MSESILMRFEVLRSEKLSELNACFRDKVQLEEKLRDIEVDIQFKRGFMEALVKASEAVIQISKAERIRQMDIEFGTVQKESSKGEAT